MLSVCMPQMFCNVDLVPTNAICIFLCHTDICHQRLFNGDLHTSNAISSYVSCIYIEDRLFSYTFVFNWACGLGLRIITRIWSYFLMTCGTSSLLLTMFYYSMAINIQWGLPLMTIDITKYLVVFGASLWWSDLLCSRLGSGSLNKFIDTLE